MLSVHNLSCVRDDRILFDKLNFNLEVGQVLQIEGRNGCGKTSLLRILCGLLLAEDGDVRWQGEKIEDVRGEYQSELNYIGHAHGVKAELTPIENLNIGRALSLYPTDISVDDALAQVGLRGFEDVLSATLSAGQRRRVALARLLTVKSRLWILDEPFTALDRVGIKNVEAMLDKHAKAGGIAVLTSHHTVICDHARIIQLDEYRA